MEWNADVAQLVEHHLAKVGVAGSNPVVRSRIQAALDPAAYLVRRGVPLALGQNVQDGQAPGVTRWPREAMASTICSTRLRARSVCVTRTVAARVL